MATTSVPLATSHSLNRNRNRDYSIRVGVTSSSSSSSKLSSPAYFLHFPQHLPFAGIGNKGISHPSRPRFPHAVHAKKQTYSSFDDLLEKSEKPLLVDFYATWCGPCQLMAPILNQVSGLLQDKVQVVKIDTEKYPSIANKYSIAALPTFILFKDGEPYDRFEGALTADQLIQRIENSLKVKQ